MLEAMIFRRWYLILALQQTFTRLILTAVPELDLKLSQRQCHQAWWWGGAVSWHEARTEGLVEPSVDTAVTRHNVGRYSSSSATASETKLGPQHGTCRYCIVGSGCHWIPAEFPGKSHMFLQLVNLVLL